MPQVRVLCVEHCIMPAGTGPIPSAVDITTTSIDELEDLLREYSVGTNMRLLNDAFSWHSFRTNLGKNPRRHWVNLEPHDPQVRPTPLIKISREEAWSTLERGLPVILEGRCWLTTIVPMPLWVPEVADTEMERLAAAAAA